MNKEKQKTNFCKIVVKTNCFADIARMKNCLFFEKKIYEKTCKFYGSYLGQCCNKNAVENAIDNSIENSINNKREKT